MKLLLHRSSGHSSHLASFTSHQLHLGNQLWNKKMILVVVVYTVEQLLTTYRTRYLPQATAISHLNLNLNPEETKLSSLLLAIATCQEILGAVDNHRFTTPLLLLLLEATHAVLTYRSSSSSVMKAKTNWILSPVFHSPLIWAAAMSNAWPTKGCSNKV